MVKRHGTFVTPQRPTVRTEYFRNEIYQTTRKYSVSNNSVAPGYQNKPSILRSSQNNTKITGVKRQATERLENENKHIKLSVDVNGFHSDHKDEDCHLLKSEEIPEDAFKEQELDMELLEDYEDLLSNIFNINAVRSELLVFDYDIKVTRADIISLRDSNWVSDQIIDYYMKLIEERAKQPNCSLPKVYAMNTSFHLKVQQKNYSDISYKTDIFTFDLILVPVRFGNHWTLSVIDFRKRCIEQYNSLSNFNSDFQRDLLQYLREEHLFQKHYDFDMHDDWRLEQRKELPQQISPTDCGVFICAFAEYLTRQETIRFGNTDVEFLRRKMAVEIVEGRLLTF